MLQAVKPHYRIAWNNRLADIPQPAWDALALPLQTPFMEWSWLNNLETSGSATAQTGWLPNHLTLWQDQTLVAAAPLYIKSHSYGEFVFDQEWADLAYRMGLNYYPKLLGMTPFTPSEGYRFLIAPGQDEAILTDLLVQAIDQFCQRNQLFGCHFLFVDPQWRAGMEQRGFSGWLHHSYIWQNHAFDHFDAYLGTFNANQRRNIKRERKAVASAGVNLKVFAGTEIPESFYPLMHRFYSETCDKFMWGSKYLNRSFFRQLYPDYAHRVLFVAAYAEDNGSTPLGMSFCITKGDRLYGRYWGCDRELDCLHFDACYYTPIEWAIAQGIQQFDPGAGGRHKKRRGFPATPNYSLHRFYYPRFAQVFSHYIGDINRAEQQAIDQINQELPFNRPS
ncbi:MAG: GNAT family N-acetyltransferase [Thermosynechococcaceae cyanobacterium]